MSRIVQAFRRAGIATHLLVFIALALAIGVAHGLRVKPEIPVADEVEFLTFGHNLSHHGHLGYAPEGPQADLGPGREPVYGFVVGVVMMLDSSLRGASLACIRDNDPACAHRYRSLQVTNGILFAAAAVTTFVAGWTLTRRRTVAWVAGLYVILNFQAARDIRYVVSDYVALLAIAAVALAAIGVARRAMPLRAAALGGALALLVLTKAVFQILAAVILIALLALTIRSSLQGRWRAGLAVLFAFVVAFAVPVGGWVARNAAWFGEARLTNGRGAIALSTREALNHMTPAQYATAFVYWTRGMGDNLARRHLPPHAWQRFEIYAPDGFYIEGEKTRMSERAARLRSQGIVDPAPLWDGISKLVIREILDEFPAYLATMLPVFYRGVWIDEFIVVGMPALVWMLVRAARRRDPAMIAALAAGVASLLLYPALSLNIPRYQITAIPALAIATACAVEILLAKRRRGRAASGAPQ